MIMCAMVKGKYGCVMCVVVSTNVMGEVVCSHVCRLCEQMCVVIVYRCVVCVVVYAGALSVFLYVWLRYCLCLCVLMWLRVRA